MDAMPDLSKVMKLLGDPTRITILSLLMNQQYYTVNEITKHCKTSISTTSYHLKKMSDIGWLTAYRRGRFSYYALADENVAEIIEKLMVIAPAGKVQSYNQKQEILAVKEARTCYQHLAGRLGVQLLDYFQEKGYLVVKDHQPYLTEAGFGFFTGLGIDVSLLQKQPGEFAKLCLDWSERRFHLAGNLGKAFYRCLMDNHWLNHSQSTRSVHLTHLAPEWLQTLL